MTADMLTGALRRLARPAGLVFGVGTFLAILGPFGSHTFGWPLVWFYWVGFIALGAAFGFTTGHWLPRLLPQAPQWSVYAASTLVLSIPVTAAVLVVNAQLTNAAPGLGRTAITFGSVFVISRFVTAVAFAIERLSGPHAGGAGATPRAGAALRDKLPVGLRDAALISMTAEDHYLRVRTDRGDALILMRLSDAAAACDGLDGARTHRSWWVARDAVVDARKGDGRGVLKLKDGVEAPVSRTYYPALRDAGWF